MATDKPRYSITLDDEMFKEVEDFRFENRYQTRNKATIELIRLGLDVIKGQTMQTEKDQTDEQQAEEHQAEEHQAEEHQANGYYKEEIRAKPEQVRDDLMG